MHGMAETEPNWAWYRSFLSVLAAGSLSGAGRALGLTQPTVGRHIDSLEAALKLKLFVRSPTGFTATDAAQALMPYATSIASTAAALRRAAGSHGAGVRGAVRVTASEVVGVEILPPILAALRDRHPALVIELVLSNDVGDLLQREADIAVRMFRPTQEALIARRVGELALGFFATRDHLDRHGTPRRLGELRQRGLIGFDTESAFIRGLQRRFPDFQRADLAFRSDSDLANLAMMRAGYGIGVCPVAVAAKGPRLVRVLPKAFAPRLESWIVMHEALRSSPRCAVTFDALVQGMERQLAKPRAGGR